MEEKDQVFGIDISELTEKAEGLEGLIYLENLKSRRIFLMDEIDQISVDCIVQNIMLWNLEDSGVNTEDRSPIIIYMSSPGGSVIDGMKLVDTITLSKTPVYTVNLGTWYSMAFVIGLAGHKRYSLPNSTLLLHEGYLAAKDSTYKMHDYVKFSESVEQRVKEFVLSKSILTEAEFDAKSRTEWYMFADEAKKYSFIDYIVGMDCTLEDIVSPTK